MCYPFQSEEELHSSEENVTEELNRVLNSGGEGESGGEEEEGGGEMERPVARLEPLPPRGKQFQYPSPSPSLPH